MAVADSTVGTTLSTPSAPVISRQQLLLRRRDAQRRLLVGEDVQVRSPRPASTVRHAV
ncbi:hypothetical protein [Streptomyces sp. NPDC054961]